MMFVKMTITGIDILLVRILGASRFGSPRGKHKESDQALRPETRTVASDWPSLVIEVGVSESLNALHLDACFWLTESSDLTRVVILIIVGISLGFIGIERWEDIPPTRPIRSSTPPYNPGMVQGLTLQENVTYTSVPLEIPYVKISDAFLNGVGSDDNLVFTTQDLDKFNQRGIRV